MAIPSKDFIHIRGAKVHNLKNINVDIPKNKLVVITGLSGSGKSSLAFDTIYAEAERRFVESLSSYARQFLGVKEKPDVESIEGLSPAIAIDQKSVSKNPRSTVGTITEIYDYLRILFSRVGEPHCPFCNLSVKRQTPDEILRKILSFSPGTKAVLLGPVIRDKKGEHKKVLQEIEQRGFLRVRADGEIMTLEEAHDLHVDPKKKHSIEVVVDRLIIDEEIERMRLRDSLETALSIGKGTVIVYDGDKDTLFSEHLACPSCGVSFPELEPRLFSFNSPHGTCPVCTGLGSVLEVDPKLVIPNQELSLGEGAIQPWARASHRVGRQSWYWWMLEDLSERFHFSLHVPVKKLPKHILQILLYGENGKNKNNNEEKTDVRTTNSGAFEGVIPNLKRRWKETDSEWTRAEIEKYMIVRTCESCKGNRVCREALAVTIEGKNIAGVSQMAVELSLSFFTALLKKSKSEMRPLIGEIVKRLQFLMNVGLGYITLFRSSVTLSGGEAQRVRLATQIGSQLTGVIYVLDEPSVGLHARDHSMLLTTLKHLRDLGNSVLIVEHDRETIEESDWIVDLGPGAGLKGGKVIFEGTPGEMRKANTLTGEYISGKKQVSLERSPLIKDNKPKQQYLILEGAREHNLKDVTIKIPLGKLICVSGVSGSGKSTLINDTLARVLMKHYYGSKEIPGAYRTIKGLALVDKAVVVDQSPIGRTPRSNPATYTGIFGPIRELFASTRDARSRGYGPGRFSFNVKGGRCEVCEGQGVKKIEMYFLPDIYVECEECHGKRYNKEALDIEYNGLTIADVLHLSCEQSCKFFKDIAPVASKLETLINVGLGYMKLGQPATTLSGGEAQRVKLATELAKKATGRTLYILDEPTTGLHFDDIQKLLTVLASLRDRGNTVLVIEHNMEVLKNADWIVDLGPEGGQGGGKIVGEGTPQQLAGVKTSYTGRWLKKVL